LAIVQNEICCHKKATKVLESIAVKSNKSVGIVAVKATKGLKTIAIKSNESVGIVAVKATKGSKLLLLSKYYSPEK
jgi:hypothetical protein